MGSVQKIVLVQPPIADFYDTDIRLQPLGLCSLKAMVERHHPGVRVVVRDFHHGRGRRTLALPPELSYLKPYYRHADKSPFCTFHHYFHFGADPETVAREVLEERPDLVGISALFTPYAREAIACARAIKTRSSVPILMGGPHVTADPSQVLGQDCVDYVIRGEGERPLVDLVQALQSGTDLKLVPNLGFKKNGVPHLNPLIVSDPLSEIAWPDYSDFPLDRYRVPTGPLCFITASRGCPYGCTFCSVRQTFGQIYRRRSNTDILAEIGHRIDQGFRAFDFEDDNLTFDQPAMVELCRELENHYSGQAHFMAMNGLSSESLNQTILQGMRRAGFTHCNLSLVSANPAILAKCRRPHRIDHFLHIVQEAFALEFQIVAYQILGLPGESFQSMIQTMAMIARLPVLIGPSLFYLTPGSPMARNFPQQRETDYYLARSTTMANARDESTRDGLYTLFITARIFNFLKGLPVPGQEIGFNELIRDKSLSAGRTGIGLDLLKILFAEKRLFAHTNSGLHPLDRFRSDLFFEACSCVDRLNTLSGAWIRLLRP